METATTILEQLGGSRFVAMTGSKNFVGSSDSLSFKVGSNAKKVTHCRIQLMPSDTYTVTFLKIRGTKVETLATDENVYAEDLEAIFTAGTGLYTRF
jgi:hypothetical protein